MWQFCKTFTQVFIHGNLEIAENYSCEVTIAKTEDPKCDVTLYGDIISVDVQKADFGQENHPGTFSFTKTMIRKLVMKNPTLLNIDITIMKKAK